MTRILTLQVEITDPELAKWIWDNHLGIDINRGINIQVIQEGPIPESQEENEI